MYNTFPKSIAMDHPTLANLEVLGKRHGLNDSAMIRKLINDAARALDGNGKRLVDPSPEYVTETEPTP